jgi:hypothetical protein
MADSSELNSNTLAARFGIRFKAAAQIAALEQTLDKFETTAVGVGFGAIQSEAKSELVVGPRENVSRRYFKRIYRALHGESVSSDGGVVLAGNGFWIIGAIRHAAKMPRDQGDVNVESKELLVSRAAPCLSVLSSDVSRPCLRL